MEVTLADLLKAKFKVKIGNSSKKLSYAKLTYMLSNEDERTLFSYFIVIYKLRESAKIITKETLFDCFPETTDTMRSLTKDSDDAFLLVKGERTIKLKQGFKRIAIFEVFDINKTRMAEVLNTGL